MIPPYHTLLMTGMGYRTGAQAGHVLGGSQDMRQSEALLQEPLFPDDYRCAVEHDPGTTSGQSLLLCSSFLMIAFGWKVYLKLKTILEVYILCFVT